MKQTLIKNIIEKYIKLLTIFLSFCVYIMFILVLTQVVFRYVFNWSLMWIEELARFIMIFIAVSGGTLALKDDIHPKIKIFYNHLTYHRRIIWELFLRILIILFLLILIFWGWSWAKANYSFITSGLEISFFWPLIIIPIGSITIFVLLVLDSIALILYKTTYFGRFKHH